MRRFEGRVRRAAARAIAGRYRLGEPFHPGRRPLWPADLLTRAIPFGLAVVIATAVLPAMAAAQEGDREQAREKLDRNRQLLEENRARAGSVKDKLEALAKERAELDQNLIRTGERIKETERSMTAIEGRLGGLEGREQDLRTSLRREHRQITGLLSAIQRMGRNPPPVMVTRREDALAMVRSAMLLARAFPRLKDRADRLAGQLKELVAVMDGIRTERDDLLAETRRLTDSQSRLSYLLQEKRRSLDLRRQELAAVEGTVRQIGENVENLEQLIARLEPTTRTDTQPPAALPPQAPGATPSAPPAIPSDGRTKVALNVPQPPSTTAPGGATSGLVPFNLEPQGGTFVAGQPIRPSTPFHLAKGQLPLPAAGEIVQQFGASTQYGDRAKGMVIKTRYGAQITAPCDGWVMFAGKFRTYGQLLIIKAGDGYHVLLAGLSRIDVEPGQFVLKAEPVGTMKSAPGKRVGPESPTLYVEFRKDGRPINPRPWWSASSIGKVQG